MLIKGVIFGRMSPDEKHELVERLQGLGYTVSDIHAFDLHLRFKPTAS